MKKQLKEELKRFNQILNYELSGNNLIRESVSVFSDAIINKLTPSLPLNSESDDVESITLLQKTLVDLGKLNKNYGIDGDGVDGDFGGDTKKALYKTIKSEQLNDINIDEFETVLDDNSDKIVNTLDNHADFFKRYVKQGGVSKDKFKKCKSITSYKDLDFVPKKNMCHTRTTIAETLNEVFPKESPINKAAILSVMIKEQGRGNKICAPNNNYAGIQTDAGRWGDLDDKIDAQFCAKDAERVRSFASFTSLSNGLSFIKKSFDRKNWFVKLLVDSDDENVETEEVDIEKISKNHAIIWQTKWNLSLNKEEFNRFKKYGYNPYMKNKSFADKKGIYKKSVNDLTTEEKKQHDKKDKFYRSPEKIQKSLDSVSNHFMTAYNIFKELGGEEPIITQPGIDDEIDMVVDLPQVTITTSKNRGGGGTMWFDPDDFKSKKDTIIPNIYGREIDIKKGDIVPDHLRNDDDDF